MHLQLSTPSSGRKMLSEDAAAASPAAQVPTDPAEFWKQNYEQCEAFKHHPKALETALAASLSIAGHALTHLDVGANHRKQYASCLKCSLLPRSSLNLAFCTPCIRCGSLKWSIMAHRSHKLFHITCLRLVSWGASVLPHTYERQAWPRSVTAGLGFV